MRENVAIVSIQKGISMHSKLPKQQGLRDIRRVFWARELELGRGWTIGLLKMAAHSSEFFK